ncbi:MAG: endonuclease III [bacterium]
MIAREKKILKLLEDNYPAAKTALKFANPWELLVATILSAQCTDKRVNIVTKTLFEKYRTIKSFANVKQENLEKDIHSTGFYKNKTKNIINSAKMLLKEFKGKVPDTMDGLLKLPGVARKTANVVTYSAFGKIYGITVDTHVGRLSQRLGFTKEKEAGKIENDLMEIFPKNSWGKISHLLIEHGRNVCRAKNPDCETCFLNNLCPKKTFSKL